MECTVLQCFTDQGRIVDITPCYRDISTDDSGKTMVEAIIQTRQAVRAASQKPSFLCPDRMLLLEGHAKPMLFPAPLTTRQRRIPSWYCPK